MLVWYYFVLSQSAKKKKNFNNINCNILLFIDAKKNSDSFKMSGVTSRVFYSYQN